MCHRFIVALLFFTAAVLQAGARSWIKGALHPVYTSMYLFLEDIDPQIYYQVLGAIIHPHFTHFSCALYVANASSNWQMGTSHEDNNLNDAFRYVALAHRMDNSVSACLCICVRLRERKERERERESACMCMCLLTARIVRCRGWHTRLRTDASG